MWFKGRKRSNSHGTLLSAIRPVLWVPKRLSSVPCDEFRGSQLDQIGPKVTSRWTRPWATSTGVMRDAHHTGLRLFF